ncbi:PREDICTED: zinc finger protein 492-like [Rhagoletis zephyria]|uniref:zinc finger protein 492-like n=1 Tax=Rhagoletis zephyria TaxID=28612 RepID=UPI0008115414|nr:PREDICTED: zinc finger protein 492-like [Rhagoletis zephyria]
MALGFEKKIIECEGLKKCGEITTMLSLGKKEFYLNCEFCDYSFLELENFMQHMYEDHLPEITLKNFDQSPREHYPNFEEDSKEILQNLVDDEMEIEANPECGKTEDTDYVLRDFERVEIEVDTNENNNSVEPKEVISNKEYISEDNKESQHSDGAKAPVVSEKFKYESEPEVESDIIDSEDETRLSKCNREKKLIENNEHRTFIIELIEVYHSLGALWDSKCPAYTDRLIRSQQYDSLLAKYRERYPNATKDDVRQKIFKLRATFRRESKQLSPKMKSQLYYFEAMRFLLKNEKKSGDNRLEQRLNRKREHSSPLHTRTIPYSLLNDDQVVILAKIYEKYPCLWDENDITYRFGNRRREALGSLNEEFNNETRLNLEKNDLDREILCLRKTCSKEKKAKIMCKQKKLVYRPTCPFHKDIEFLEVDVNPFECQICGKVISGSCIYKIHVASHDGSLPFKCHICGHGFKLTTNLTVHLRRHVQDFTYSCKLCNKPCATTTELKVHMRYHTGEKPFVCDICGNKFNTASKFDTHKRRHENRPRHRCEICAKGFYTMTLYREHMSVHRNIRDQMCDVCNKGFKNRMQLKQHKRIHDPVKKFVCKLCDKRFAQFAGLSGHMKSHGTKLTAKKTSAEMDNITGIFLSDNTEDANAAKKV